MNEGGPVLLHGGGKFFHLAREPQLVRKDAREE